MGFKNYSAADVTVNFGAINIESGRGDDEFVSIEQDEENFTYKAGVDGEGTRSETKNRKTRVTLTLMQTSAANDLLSAVHELDKKTSGGAGVVPLIVRDRSGTQVFTSAEAWIVKPPDQKYAKEAGTRVWLIDCHDPQRFDGGH